MRNFVIKLVSKTMARVGPKAIKYLIVSGISLVVAQAVLFGLFGVARWTTTSSNIAATAISAVPAYYLNRNWAWGKTGRSHFLKEVAPFWIMAFLGLALSMWTISLANSFALQSKMGHLQNALMVNGASIMAFGVLWVGKFFILNKVLFVERISAEYEG